MVLMADIIYKWNLKGFDVQKSVHSSSSSWKIQVQGNTLTVPFSFLSTLFVKTVFPGALVWHKWKEKVEGAIPAAALACRRREQCFTATQEVFPSSVACQEQAICEQVQAILGKALCSSAT